METGVPPLPLIGIIELQAKTLKILEFKGPVAKIFRNKDLSCQRAMKMVLGQFRGAVLVDRRASKLPQSESLRYRCALRFLSQWISITSGFDEKSQRLSSRPNKILRLTRLWNPRSRKARDPSTSSGQALGHAAGWGSGMAAFASSRRWTPISSRSKSQA